jgi:mannose-6-phosphate isomerase-like protein (cupin superfamily)
MSAFTESTGNKLLVRYTDLVPNGAGFLDTRASGPIDSQDFIIIGGTLTQPAAGYIHIAAPHAFDIVGMRQFLGSATISHCRDGAEALIAHVGRWRVVLGPSGENDSIELNPGDVVSVPAGVYRRVQKLDEGAGFLFIVRGSTGDHDPTWPPAVFASATDAGLKMVDGGRWIDYSSGMALLKESDRDGVATDRPTAGVGTPVARQLSDCAIGAAGIAANLASPLAADGVEEAGVIAPRATRDGFEPGPIRGWWPHGFTLRRLTLQSGAYIPMHSRTESQVFLLQEGTMEVSSADDAIMLGAGDTLTVPIGLPHALRNTTSRRTEVFVVHGSEDPAMPLFQSMPVRDRQCP